MLTKLSDLCVYCSEIPEEGFVFDLKKDIKALEIQTDDFDIDEPVHIKGSVRKFGKDIYVQGHLTIKMIMTCSRCLERFTHTLDSEFEATYAPLEDEISEEEKELEKNDLDVLLYKGDCVDLREAIRDQIILSIPLKSLCKKNCLGLCSQCGQNLNTIKCDCAVESIDPRLEKLKQFKSKN